MVVLGQQVVKVSGPGQRIAAMMNFDGSHHKGPAWGYDQIAVYKRIVHFSILSGVLELQAVIGKTVDAILVQSHVLPGLPAMLVSILNQLLDGRLQASGIVDFGN